MRVLQGWAEVAQVGDEVRAILLVDHLRSFEIEATVFSQKDRWHVVTFGGLAVVRILVPAARYVEALGLLPAAPAPRAAG